MTPLLYEIPEKFLSGIASGNLKLYGAILKNTVTGQILAHVQPTSVLDKLLASTLQGVSTTISQGFNPLGILTTIQNEQIKSRLTAMNTTLGVMQNLQVGTLAVSGLGLGVSVAGFALMLKRLNAIEAHLHELGGRIERVTSDRRSDDLEAIFADIATDLETIDTLYARRSAQQVAEAAQVSLFRSASRLRPHFKRVAEKEEDLTHEDLDLLWSLASAIRLCSDAGFKALLHIDELAVAADIARKEAERFAELSDPLAPDRLARLCSKSAAGFNQMTELRTVAIGKARILTNGLRASAIQTASHMSLANTLIERGISGQKYLEEAEQEQGRPLLMLPAQ